jgi:hypothetical protein
VHAFKKLERGAVIGLNAYGLLSSVADAFLMVSAKFYIKM